MEDPDAENVLPIQRLLADAVIYKVPFEDIEIILKNGGDLNEPVVRGLRAIHYAVYSDDVKYAQFLIDKGADIDVCDESGYSPLHLSVQHKNQKCIDLLLEKGAKLNFVECGLSECDPLSIACDNRDKKLVKLLLEKGANPNNKYFMGHEINLIPFEHLYFIELLLEHGANPNAFSRIGFTPLMKACREKDIAAVKLLLSHGADVHLQSLPRFEEKTALHHAILSGNADIMIQLLEAKASVLDPVCINTYPLTLAVSHERVEITHLLLQYGANVNEMNCDGLTPLLAACCSFSSRVDQLITLLLEGGADPNLHSKSSFYTLCSKPGHAPLIEYFVNYTEYSCDIVQLFIKHGAKICIMPHITAKRGINPYGIAGTVVLTRLKRQPEILAFLTNAAESVDPVYVNALPEKHPLKQALVEAASGPLSLLAITRFALRRMIKKPLPANVETLPLPELLKLYLVFQAELCLNINQ